MVNLLALAQGERLNAMIALRSFEDTGSVFMVTQRGIVKRTGLMEFINAKRAGIFAITLDRADFAVYRRNGRELSAIRITVAESPNARASYEAPLW